MLDEHSTVWAAFAALDAVVSRIVALGAPPDALDLLIVDSEGRIVARPHLE